MLIAIVAMDPNRVIGRDGKLPWYLPDDLAFFKKTTLGHPVLMGRKTFESIGKPLPKRRNIVLTRDLAWNFPGVESIHDLGALSCSDTKIFIIGGAEIYRVMSARVDQWLVSHVHNAYEGDTYLAEFEQDFPDVEIALEHPEFTVKHYTRGISEKNAIY